MKGQIKNSESSIGSAGNNEGWYVIAWVLSAASGGVCNNQFRFFFQIVRWIISTERIDIEFCWRNFFLAFRTGPSKSLLENFYTKYWGVNIHSNFRCIFFVHSRMNFETFLNIFIIKSQWNGWFRMSCYYFCSIAIQVSIHPKLNLSIYIFMIYRFDSILTL